MTGPEKNDSPLQNTAASRAQPGGRSWTQAILRGLKWHCPSCGKGRLFGKYLKVSDRCASCGEELHHHRADDAPPYFTIFIVGHIVIPAMLIVEKMWHPQLWIHMALWLPLATILTLAILPGVKGAVVGLQWALYMHGFQYSALCAPKKQPGN